MAWRQKVKRMAVSLRKKGANGKLKDKFASQLVVNQIHSSKQKQLVLKEASPPACW